MEQSVCRLCLRPGALQKSHYIPAALYATPANMAPAALYYATPTKMNGLRLRASVSEEHMRERLLCQSCTELLDRNGEAEVLRHVAAKSVKNLPLSEKLKSATPLDRWVGMAMVSGPSVGVDTDKLAYFALSVIWRGAVHDWKMFDGSVRPRNTIGDFEEPIRRYLLGDAPFPSDTAVIVTVCTDEHEGFFAMPDVYVKDNCLSFRFIARGIFFQIMMGSLPQTFRDRCCTSERKCIWYEMPEVMGAFEKN